MHWCCQFCKQEIEDITSYQLHLLSGCSAMNNSNPQVSVEQNNSRSIDTQDIIGNIIDDIGYDENKVETENVIEAADIDIPNMDEASLPEELLCNEIVDSGGNTSMLMKEYSQVILEVESSGECGNTDDIDDDSDINVMEMMKTYEKLYEEKQESDKKLMNVIEVVKLCKEELAINEEKLCITRADNQYLRTENTRLKNQLKEIKANSECEMQDIKEDVECCTQTVRELSDLRNDFSNFRKFVYDEISLLKGNVVDGSVSSAEIRSIDDSYTSTSEVVSVVSNGDLNNNYSITKDDESFKEPTLLQETFNKGNKDKEKKQKIVPGVKPYSKAHLRTTLVLADSTIGRIPVWQLKENIALGQENVIIKRHPGSTADEISHFSTKTLNDIRPDQVIVFAGTNDISKGLREKSLNEFKIVDDILDIGRYAKTLGTKNIYISSILVRWGYQYANIITRLNDILERLCNAEGFIFLNHSDITKRHIWSDGLHPNNQGYLILKMNMLMCFYTFNPYLSTFYDLYEKAL